MTRPRAVNQFDEILTQLVGSLVRSVNEMPQAAAMAGKVKLTKSEQQARYQVNKENPSFWNDIAAKHGRTGVYEYWKAMSEKESQHAPEKITGEPAGEPEAPGGG